MILKNRTPDAEVGVIVGRFQVHELHKGHHDLIQTVRKKHGKVLVLIGCVPDVRATRRNPLDYFTRHLMITKAYPDVMTSPIYNVPSDHVWSQNVDDKIYEAFGGVESALLYGSRDAFIPHYHGKHPTIELDAARNMSGSEIRRIVSDEVRAHSEFRRGAIYAASNRHPTMYPTVDIALYDRSQNQLALGRKKRDKPGAWRFPGGFVSPEDSRLEDAAKRELIEEMGSISVAGELTYLGSVQVNDWRYRDEVDGIMTSFFLAPYQFGALQASDDLDQARWFDMNKSEEIRKVLVGEHVKLFDILTAHLEKGQGV